MRDANNIGFQLVVGASDWASRFGVPSWDGGIDDAERASAADAASRADIVYNAEDTSLSLRPVLARFVAATSEGRLDGTARRGAARDRYGTWYEISADRSRIVVRTPTDGRRSPFWPDPDAGPSDPPASTFAPKTVSSSDPARTLRGLTITTRHFLVVGTTSPNALLVFDLHGSGPPVELEWTTSETFTPVDIAPRPGGGIWILDHPDGESPRLWGLDCHFRLVTRVDPEDGSAPDFQDVDGDKTDPILPTAPPDVAWAAPLNDVQNPVAIETLPDDTVLVLDVTASGDESESTVFRFDYDEPQGRVSLNERLELALPEDAAGALDAWQAYDFAFLPGTPSPIESARGTLYVVGTGGNQAYAFRLSASEDRLTLGLRNRYIPLRRYQGTGLVAADDSVYYDLDDRWVPLVEQPRPRFVDDGIVETTAPFDSDIPDAVWHRIFIDACIPAGTRVRVETRASNTEALLDAHPWQEEPDVYRRDTGPEVAAYEPYTPRERRRSGTGTWEVLVQRAEGRFLDVRLVLEGTGRATPEIYALRTYAPRFSYLDYLPDVYKEDETSASFVDRYLANAEGTLTALEGRIATAQTLFDTRTVPDEYLDWLAAWFGTALDPALDPRRKRLFLDHAIDLFNQRGTATGLVRILELIFDPCADESLFETDAVAASIGRPQDARGDDLPRRFGVRVIEEHATRSVSAVAVGDPTAAAGPQRIRRGTRWTLAEGAASLHERFHRFLTSRYDGGTLRDVWAAPDAIRFPPLLPAGTDDATRRQQREDWRTFVRQQIDGPYAEVDPESLTEDLGARADDVTQRYRAFLRRRYPQPDRVPVASVRRLSDPEASIYDRALLPRTLPDAPDALRDWIHFVTVVLPIARSAHRFRVLVPTDLDAPTSEQAERLDLARRIVEREKPAHTRFDVQPYWALFQVGTARLGIDTLLGEGSRYTALLLGEGILARGTLGRAYPDAVPDRFVSGRDTPGDTRPL